MSGIHRTERRQLSYRAMSAEFVASIMTKFMEQSWLIII